MVNARARRECARDRVAGWLGFAALCTGALLGGCASMIEEASSGPATAVQQDGPVTLVPFVTLSQGTLTAKRDAAGLPLPASGMQPLRLVRPVAVAARGEEVFVVDPGQSALFRVDPPTGLYARVTGVVAGENTRIEIGPDGTLTIADSATRQIGRMMPGGQRVAPLGAASTELGQPVDMALDEPRGRLVVADGVYRQLIAFAGGGEAFSILALGGDDRLQVRALSHVAVGPRHVYLADPQCRCVLVAAVDGPLTGTLAGPAFGRITAMAADRAGRLYVADGEAREIRVFAQARPLQKFSYRSLMVTEISDLHFADGLLWIVDPAGAKVQARRVVSRSASRAVP